MDNQSEEHDPDIWAPGTVRIEAFLQNSGDGIILHPQPSDDPNDPLNWSRRRKNWNFALCCFYALMVAALIDAATPTWGPMGTELGFSYSILNDSYAIGSATMSFGAFLLIPFALKYGRRPIYIISAASQFAISIWSAKMQTVADLMLVNALSSGIGALAEVIVQMSVADLFFVHQRGLMNTIYIWITSVGDSLAPVAAGYITLSQGWRWVWWWNAIFFGICVTLFVFSYEETKYTNSTISGVVEHHADPLVGGDQKSISSESKESVSEAGGVFAPASDSSSEEQGSIQELSAVAINPNIPLKTYWQRLAFTTTSKGTIKSFARHSYQPAAILVTIPAVFYMSLVHGVMLAWSTVMVAVLSTYMTLPPYNFNSAQIGLMSLPPFIGTTMGSLVIGPLSDWSILYLARRNRGIYEPEMRLWMMAPFVPFVPVGALMFGIGLNNGASWPFLAVGYAICNFGAAPISSLALTYITDSYTEIVGDALVGVTFTRNAFGTVFVFALTPWIAASGIANVFIAITVLGTIILCFVFVFILFGKKFRFWTAQRYRYFAARQFGSRQV